MYWNRKVFGSSKLAIMRLHETWTGAANPGDRTFSVASVEGVSFTVINDMNQ